MSVRGGSRLFAEGGGGGGGGGGVELACMSIIIAFFGMPHPLLGQFIHNKFVRANLQ